MNYKYSTLLFLADKDLVFTKSADILSLNLAYLFYI